MPYGAKHDHVFKEQNTQPGGRQDAKASTKVGPAYKGRMTQKPMHETGLGRPVRGKVSAPASAKQYRK